LPVKGFPGEADHGRFLPTRLHEEVYCARGEMENLLKQETLDLQADRMSAHYLASNQLRLWLATLAYLLMERLCALGLAGTDLASATAGSVRLKLLKVAAQVRVSVRRVYGQLNTAHQYRPSVAGTVSTLPPALAGPGQRQWLTRRDPNREPSGLRPSVAGAARPDFRKRLPPNRLLAIHSAPTALAA
jgi:hypothetical protein